MLDPWSTSHLPSGLRGRQVHYPRHCAIPWRPSASARLRSYDAVGYVTVAYLLRVQDRREMSMMLRLDGVDYEVERLSPVARYILERLQFVQNRLQELQDHQALLTKAKRAYISDLKAELLRPSPRSGLGGLNLSTFLTDDDQDTF